MPTPGRPQGAPLWNGANTPGRDGLVARLSSCIAPGSMDLADRLLQNGLHLLRRHIVPEAPPEHPPLTIQHHKPVGARHPEPGEERAALAGVCPHLKEIHIPFETRS